MPNKETWISEEEKIYIKLQEKRRLREEAALVKVSFLKRCTHNLYNINFLCL